MGSNYKLPSQEFLLIVVIILAVLVIVCISTHAQQTFEIQRGRVENGKLKITDTWRYPLARAYAERDKLYKKLKPGEVLIGPSWIETVSVEVKDVELPKGAPELIYSTWAKGSVVEVYSQGFTPEQMETIKKAVESWGRFRFMGQGQGQLTIKWKAGLAERDIQAETEMKIIDDVLVSAEMFIDPSTTNLSALQSVVAHESGHTNGLSDCEKCDSIMKSKNKGKGKTNGRVAPSAEDLAAIK